MMRVPEGIRELLSGNRPDQAVAQLQRLAPEDAADLLMRMPFEAQEAVFRKLPVEFAAALIAVFPYYHAYVLLHSRPAAEMKSIVDRMKPGDRMHFFDELTGEAWQELMDELSQ